VQPRRQAPTAVTRVFATITVGLGVALVVRTLIGGGGPSAIGLILGVLFIAVGMGRLYLLARMR